MYVLQQNISTVIISQDRAWLTLCVMHRIPKETGLRFYPSLLSGICQHGTWISLAIFWFLSAFHISGQTSNIILAVRDIWWDGTAPHKHSLKVHSVFTSNQVFWFVCFSLPAMKWQLWTIQQCNFLSLTLTVAESELRNSQ